MTIERIPEWMRDHRDNEDYWREVITKADALTGDEGSPMASHDVGECSECDALRLRDWEELESDD